MFSRKGENKQLDKKEERERKEEGGRDAGRGLPWSQWGGRKERPVLDSCNSVGATGHLRGQKSTRTRAPCGAQRRPLPSPVPVPRRAT